MSRAGDMLKGVDVVIVPASRFAENDVLHRRAASPWTRSSPVGSSTLSSSSSCAARLRQGTTDRTACAARPAINQR